MWSRLFRIFQKRSKVILLGLENSGKTTFLYRITDKMLVENSPTFGFNKEFCTKLGIRLEIIDVGGNSKLVSLWRHYITGASAVLYFVDSGDITRTQENYEHLKKLCNYPEVGELPVLIVLNKSDISEQVNESDYEEIRKLKNNCEICKVSAKTGEGVDATILLILSQLGSSSAKRKWKKKMKSKLRNQTNEKETLSSVRKIRNFFEGKCCLDFSNTENLKDFPSIVPRVPVLPPQLPSSKPFDYLNESIPSSSSYTKQLVSKVDKKENKKRLSFLKKKETKSRKSFSKSAFSSRKGFSRFH